MLNDWEEGEVRGGLSRRERGDASGAIRERDVTARIETTREPSPDHQRTVKSAEVTSAGARADEAVTTRTAPARVADYLFIAIYSLLGVRLLIALLGASADTGVARAIAVFTDPLYAPFRAVADPADETGRLLALPVLIALVASMLVHAVIGMMLRRAGQDATADMRRSGAH